jgi:hypothetical protein
MRFVRLRLRLRLRRAIQKQLVRAEINTHGGNRSATFHRLGVLLEAAAQREVEEALEGVWAYTYDGMWLVVLVAQLFWALLFFGMIGDVYGYDAGLQEMQATMLCLPLLTHWLVRIILPTTKPSTLELWVKLQAGLTMVSDSPSPAVAVDTAPSSEVAPAAGAVEVCYSLVTVSLCMDPL